MDFRHRQVDRVVILALIEADYPETAALKQNFWYIFDERSSNRVELEIVCGITVATDGTTVPHSHWILCLFCTFLGASNQARRGAESEGIMQPLDRAVCTWTIQTRLLVATAVAARICCSKQTMCTQQMCTQIRKKLHKHRQACDYCTYRPIFFRQAIWMGKNEMAIGMRPVGTHLYFWVLQTNWDYFPSVKS